jgi:hypothetical protein
MNDTGILKLFYEYIFEPAGETQFDEEKDGKTSIKSQKAWNIICTVTDDEIRLSCWVIREKCKHKL